MQNIYILFFILFYSFGLFSQNNDDITNAIEIFCDSPIQSTTIGFLSDQSLLTDWELDECGTSVDGSSGVWYYMEGDDSDYSIRMCDSSYDTKLHIFQDDGFNMSCVTGNDDGYVCESSYLHSAVSFYASSGNTYYIYVSGYGNYEGDFNLTLYCNIYGCIDPEAENFCATCIEDDGSCEYTTGCMDIAAINYNEENDISDPESCEYPTECEEGEQLIMIDIII
ncbi:MAG: hypothetical protein CMP49_03115, partial [Flavobacteriales bacterium]|nr:hypothetical protein [Flavobacteriales bacterium]